LHGAILILDATGQIFYYESISSTATQTLDETTRLGEIIMNTLTQFIDIQLSLTESTTATSMSDINGGQATSEETTQGQYEVIENENFTGNHFNSLALSGSLFSLTTFTDVLFESCAFYASKMENCTFLNVNFKNCTFEFTQIQHCNFNNCTFEGCTFQISGVSKSSFAYCTYEGIVDHVIQKGDHNKEFNCTKPEILTWEEVLADNNSQVAASSDHSIGDEDEQTASLKLGLFGIIEEVFSKKKAA
tara:strand:+ start:6928 stop:7668 length:741 start_codon:yes stop_codon:yes gene_type:complete